MVGQKGLDSLSSFAILLLIDLFLLLHVKGLHHPRVLLLVKTPHRGARGGNHGT